MKKTKKEWIEFVIVCVIIGVVLIIINSDDVITNIIVIIFTAMVLAIVRVAIMFYPEIRKNYKKK